MKPFNEGPAVEPRGAGHVAGRQRRPELHQVGGKRIGVEGHVGRGRPNDVVAQFPLEHIEGLREQPAGARDVLFRPEQPHHPLARDGGRKSLSDHGKECETPRLCGASGHRRRQGPRGGDGRGTKQVQVKRGRRGAPITGLRHHRT